MKVHILQKLDLSVLVFVKQHFAPTENALSFFCALCLPTMMYLALLSVAAAAKCPLASVKCRSTVFAKDFAKIEEQEEDLRRELGLPYDTLFRPRDQIVYDLECRDSPYAVATSNGLFVRFMADKGSDWQVAMLPVSEFKQLSCETELQELTWEDNEAAIEMHKKHKKWLPAQLALFPKDMSDLVFSFNLFGKEKDLFEQSLIGKFCLDDKLGTDGAKAAPSVYMAISMSTMWLKPLQRQQLPEGRLRRVECPKDTRWVWARLVKNKPRQVLLIDTNLENLLKNNKDPLTELSSLKQVCKFQFEKFD